MPFAFNLYPAPATHTDLLGEETYRKAIAGYVFDVEPCFNKSYGHQLDIPCTVEQDFLLTVGWFTACVFDP